MNAWKIVAATLIIFIAGIATGVVLVRIGERERHPWVQGIQPGGNPQPLNSNLPGQSGRRPDPAGNGMAASPAGVRDRDFVQLLQRRLQLSPEQRQQIAVLVAEGQDRIRALRQGVEPQVQQEMQKTHEQIRAVLTPEQREQFQRLMKQRLERRNDPNRQPPNARPGEFREPRPRQEPPPGPPPVQESVPEPPAPRPPEQPELP